jgi:hypothetical protein
LGSLPLLSNCETRSISAENPNGEKGGGAKAEPNPNEAASELGKGWKARPCTEIPAGETITLADIEGPGTIQSIWLTSQVEALRSLILRFYWDDEETPSVEVPMGDFFCNGHGLRYNVNSLPVAVNPVGACNCFWPMPFRKHARITLENQYWETMDAIFYQINYALGDVPEDAAYFHAQWRRAMTTRENPDYLIVDGIQGQGHYVGTFLAWTQMSNGWWGEGEIKFFMDGDGEYPTICGTGTEDYFGGAWCFEGQTYSTPFLGYPLYRKEPGEVPRHGLYRWHILDPVRFKKDLRVTIQALGWWPNAKFQPLTDDIASVAYWYQSEPHGEFPPMLPLIDRFSR